MFRPLWTPDAHADIDLAWSEEQTNPAAENVRRFAIEHFARIEKRAEEALKTCCRHAAGRVGLLRFLTDLVIGHDFERAHHARVIPRLAAVRGARVEKLLRGCRVRQ